jgi:CRP-like cAMP-binding protein
MHIEEVKLLREVSATFMADLGQLVHEELYPQGYTIFERGEPAEHLYVLVGGGVDLYLANGGSVNFMIEVPGEVFGWSALVDPKIYKMSARTYSRAKVLKIRSTQLEHLFARHPADGFVVMKRLASVVAQRLMEAYRELVHQGGESQSSPSYG